MKKALICGISGQDGSYLARHLLAQGYEVCGTSRDAQISTFRNLTRLGIRDRVKLVSMSLTDFRSVLQVLSKIQPYEVYNLGGQSSVGLSFEQPVETLDSIATGTLNLLEAIRFTGAPIKLYNAGSSECFGDTKGYPADETTPFRPRSPYGVAKAAAFWEVANYREAYGVFACSGILYNHESPLRPERFVTQKIVSAACQIAKNNSERLYLGNISVQRDWGYAAEYVEAMHAMLQQQQPDDYVIATGQTNKLEDFVREAFAYFDLNWQDYVVCDSSLYRPTDIALSRGNPTKAKEQLKWEAQYEMRDVVREMVEARLHQMESSESVRS
ncbi:MAG: GDP-mannose 4,6-dehydratase [Cyanobacteriota bacterium]|nr:GDP-mannose 4,6-dehydratase [Cyanobacteriota bacterium]